MAIVTTFRTWRSKGVWGRCPQPAFDLSAQAEGGSTVRLSAHAEAPAPRPIPSVYCHSSSLVSLERFFVTELNEMCDD